MNQIRLRERDHFIAYSLQNNRTNDEMYRTLCGLTIMDSRAQYSNKSS
jgi:hypothetical protein